MPRQPSAPTSSTRCSRASARLPGVDAAGFVTVAPGQGYWGDWGFTIVEHPPLPQGSGLSAYKLWADPKYFATMGIPLLRGRTFDFGKRLDAANEVIINQSFANQYFPGEDPVGKHINAPLRHHTAEVVGIVGDTRSVIGEKPLPMMYFPLDAGVETVGTLVIRSSHDVEQYALPVQRIVAEMDSDLPVSDVLTMNQLLGKHDLGPELQRNAAHGVRNTVTGPGRGGTVRRDVIHRSAADDRNRHPHRAGRKARTRDAEDVDGWNVARDLSVWSWDSQQAWKLAGLMRDLLYEIKPLDPAVFAAVAATLLAVAAFACIVPAWRASRLDPMQALRAE